MAYSSKAAMDPDAAGSSHIRMPNIKSPAMASATTNVLGLLHDNLLPSLNLHSSLALITYTASRVTRRVELKDWLWPSGMVLNAWYHGVWARSSETGLSLSESLSTLGWTQKLLLGGVTLWGVRLFGRIATRSVKRGKDDPRYDDMNQDTSFWNKAFFTVFLPEAVFQALISLSWSIVLQQGTLGSIEATPPRYGALLHGLAVGLYTTGLNMEAMADQQLEEHKKTSDDLDRSGVFSIVRHPNSLGDALVHFSFPLLLAANGMFHPLSLVGPVANYVFLRFIGGDKQNEESQEQRYKTDAPKKYAQLEGWRANKNSFWPALKEVTNPWSLALVGIGAFGVLAERGLRRYLRA
jgi:steroid 5-alpha reductase family enzyme